MVKANCNMVYIDSTVSTSPEKVVIECSVSDKVQTLISVLNACVQVYNSFQTVLSRIVLIHIFEIALFIKPWQ